MKTKILLMTMLLATSVTYAQQDKTSQTVVQTLWLMNNLYVDSVDLPKITQKGIQAMLKELDPHSVYIAAKDVQRANEPLQGNIEGIGVTFQLKEDTIHVVDVVADGPSEKVGILPGDRIIKVNDSCATGDSINNDWVLQHLRGKKGSKVKVDVFRIGKGDMVFNIIRDKIPINSIDTWFMIDDEIGYISLRRYSQTSDEEFQKAVKDLKKQGMKKLIFDLRSNGGGYLDQAQKIVDEFLDGNKLIVYTKGVRSPKQTLLSGNKGVFENGHLVILTDEYTASASEITAGAIQDWDRGVILGRRTFGKGLVQRPINMVDSSQIRLTIARYYIPSGRCIQKPYKDGVEEYYKDYQKRYSHKEMFFADSIQLPDSLKYKTNNNRVVYGGGGIMPDVFVPMDTSRASDYFINLRSKNIFNDFALSWVENNRDKIIKQYPDYESFNKAWAKLNLMEEFEKFASQKGVNSKEIKPQWIDEMINDYIKDFHKDSTKSQTFTSYSEYTKALLDDKMVEQIKQKALQEDNKQQEYILSSNKYIEANLKGIVARNLYGVKYYYKAVGENDDTLKAAIKLLKDDKQYDKILSGKY